ncbi:MAG: HAD hydrolase-like protein [SAR324 cluster bacterium]|nr:HAD hydrolase-like protein [SAR324 cluster bacterium]MCZ6627947.1 HAD hydrolase-like protein [SAR324 cluster bacterium]
MSSIPQPKEGLIFDLDGTLVDTLPDIATAINLTRGQYGMDPLPADQITGQVGNGTAYLVRQTVPVAEHLFEEAHGHYGAFYEQHMLDQSRLHDGVVFVLDHFRNRALGVVTNKPIRQTETLLTGLCVRERFGTVLGGDSLARMKPDPLPLTHFICKHGLRPEQVVMIGDGINDVRAGKAAGVMTVAVTYGVASRKEMIAEQPDFIIDRMDGLLDIIA